MKRLLPTILILIWVGAEPTPLLRAQPSADPPSAPVEKTQSLDQRDGLQISLDAPFSLEKESPSTAKGGRLHFNKALQLESGGDRQSIPGTKASDAERTLRNNLSRFENQDEHGALILSFSRDTVDLAARSVSGEEAWILRWDYSPEK
ncbi:MAG TPA: hypothetical protein VI382_00335 [Candidatus Manganitrophaceae bacterium]|nr:hypothetical protein [Candidatus Manganitrophaceae bacterium]